MKTKLLLFAFTLLSTMLFSQAVPMAFEDFRTNDGTQNFFYKNVVKTDASGNIYTLGATTTSNSTTDILLSKKNSAGITLWTKQINGTANYHDFGAGLLITTAGEVYITGAITNNTTTLNPDLIVQKYNSSGTQQFSMTYTATGYGAVGKDIVSDGINCYITGAAYNSSLKSDILTLAVTTSSGSLVWADIHDYATLNDGGVKIAYRSSKVTVTGGVTVSANNYKIATLTYTAATGVLSETITTGSTMTSSVEIVTDMTTDAAGNTYLSGAYEVAGQGYNYYLAKLTSSLTIAWEQTYNSPSNLNDVAKGVKVDASGNVYITGVSTNSVQGKDIRTIKYNSSGTLQWNIVENSSINGDDEGFDMEMDNSSNIYVCGSISSVLDQKNYYTVKYNSSGTKIWEIQSDGIHLNDQATNMALDSLNNVIVTGQSETVPGTYVYTTFKYVQKDVITPTDFNGETPNRNYMYFKNNGQLSDTSNISVTDVKFYTYNTNPSFYFKNFSQSLVFSRMDTVVATNDTMQRIDVTFTNGHETAKTYPMDEQKTDFYLNYFLAHTGSRGITGVHGNQRLITQDLYTNIDLMMSSNQNGVKYYFIVKPGGDMRDIKLEFTGATSFSLNGTTNALSINSSIGSLTFDKPVAYQLTTGNATVAVTSFSPTWTTDGASNKYKFNNGTYTSSLTLVIEVDQGNTTTSATNSISGNLNYSTYYGSTGNELFNDVKVDANFRYVTGYASTSAFPVTTGVLFKGGLRDAVLLKYTLNTDSLRFATFYGGTDDDVSNTMAVTTTGEIYIGGTTKSTDIVMSNTKVGATLQSSNAWYSGSPSSTKDEGFLAEFAANGQSIKWSRYLGGLYKETLTSITLDASGNLYVCGSTNSDNYPYTAGAYKTSRAGSYGVNWDMFVMKMNSGSVVQWSTFYGGNYATATQGAPYGDEFANTIAVDNSGNIYVGGQTASADYPVIFPGTPGSNSVNYSTKKYTTDGALVKFNSGGTPVWSSYFGGDFDDQVTKIKLTSTNDMIVVGWSNSRDTLLFPVKRKAGAFHYIHTYQGEKAFFSKIASNFDNLWTTFYSRHNYSQMFVNGLTVVNDGFIVGGTTTSDSINVPATLPAGAYAKSTKSPTTAMGYLTYFNSDLSLLHAHYFGGNYNGSQIKSVTNDNNNAVYFVGGAYKFYPIAYTIQDATLIDSTYSSPGTDGTITRLSLSVIAISVREITKAEPHSINAFPNPVLNEFYIDTKDLKYAKNYSINIYNVQGQLICNFTNKDFNSDLLKINCGNWSNGLYVVSISTDAGQYTSKLIKQ